MESIFEPLSLLDAGAYDPTFLSFSSFSSSSAHHSSASSFSACASAPIPAFDLSPLSDATSTFLDCDAVGLSFDPYEIIHGAFDSFSPDDQYSHDYGIFHAGSGSKLSRADVDAASASASTSTSTADYSPTRPGSSEFDSPLVTPAARDNVAFTSPDIFRTGFGFSWDDAPSSLSASSSYIPPTPAPAPAHAAATPLRVASNPHLGSSSSSSSRHHALRPISSMPALKEEEPLNWLNMPEEPILDEFDWVFGDLGSGTDTAFDATIFSAFKENEPDTWDLGLSTQVPTPAPAPPSVAEPLVLPVSVALPQQAPQQLSVQQQQTQPQQMQVQVQPQPVQQQQQPQQMSSFSTFSDPFATLYESRPATAPDGLDGMGMLSAPGMMTRSYTAPGNPNRSAAPSDIFYQPPQQPTHSLSFPPPRSLSGRRGSAQLSVNVNVPASQSTFSPVFPLTPQSATYPSSFSSLPTPPPMVRAGTQPLPSRRSSSVSHPQHGPGAHGHAGGSSASGPMPAHLARAHAIVQMQEAKDEAERQQLRREAASRRVPMSQASVMQPLHPAPSTYRPAIVGWEGSTGHSHPPPPRHIYPAHHHQQQHPANPPPYYVPPQPHSRASSGSGSAGQHMHPPPALTNQPLVVHPPPPQYAGSYQAPLQHRVHPPPLPPSMPSTSSSSSSVSLGSGSGMTAAGRPMARLPSPKTRKVSSPSKRSPSGKRRGPMQPGGFSWGEATFINFTSDDADKLLTGVAPSGSQSKRKREEEAARNAAVSMDYASAPGASADGMGMGVGGMGSLDGINMGMGSGMSMGMNMGIDMGMGINMGQVQPQTLGQVQGQGYDETEMEREGSKRSRLSE